MGHRNIALIFLYIGVVFVSAFANQLINKSEEGQTLGIQATPDAEPTPENKIDRVELPITDECIVTESGVELCDVDEI